MSCTRCEQFDTTVELHAPSQVRRVVEKVRTALVQGELQYNSFQSDRELVGQPSFAQVDLSLQLPDVMRYHFHCSHCGQCYGLFVEAYHGSGGKWSALGKDVS